MTPKTLRIWDKKNKLKPVLTSGGHRRYKKSDINKILGIEEIQDEKKEVCVTYARVSSQKQKVSDDLDRQWTCPQCGEVIERDYNASLNILDEGLRILSA